ncbi:hypothetical protein Salpa_3718 [Sporomusa sp. KB1]|jgi:hypothetical protein|nr:hypothetical protein Salpa_3718 [Sporomusa sp. KB1]
MNVKLNNYLLGKSTLHLKVEPKEILKDCGRNENQP